MTVLVTGGLGMLGAAAVRELLRAGHSVVVLARSDHRERVSDIADDFPIEIGDVRDVNTVYDVMAKHKVERVCHVAAVLTAAGRRAPRLAYEVNVGATIQLLTAVNTLGARRFVFVSSKAAYAMASGAFGAPTYEPVSEDYSKVPSNLYGATKLAAEVLIEHMGQAMGTSAAILRFGTTFGPGKGDSKYGPRAEISEMIEAAHRGEDIAFKDSGERADAIYVKDIGKGIALAVSADLPGVEAYNIGTGVGISLSDVRDAVMRAVPGARVQLTPAPPDPASDRRNVVMDVRKAEKDLGFRAEFDIQAAVYDYLAALSGGAQG